MKVFYVISFLFFLLLDASVVSAQNDSLKLSADSVYVPDTARFKSDFRKKFALRWHTYPHSPLKATLLSAMLPGAGQIYNGSKKQTSFAGKYWKVPIVYGGIATCIWFIDWNTGKYRYYKNQYIAEVDGDLSTINETGRPADNLNTIQNQYHRWMDVSYMSLLGIYVLQIIDANVDAHLFYYDIGNDISLEFHPSVIQARDISPALGMTLKF